MSGPARLLVFTGDGKGKTTAALGMALRAAGHRQRVLFVQFVKADASTGEVAAVQHLPGLRLVQAGLGFVPQPTHSSYPAHRAAALAGLDLVAQALRDDTAELVVLDEVCVAIARGLLDVQAVLAVLGNAQPSITMVLTGRHAPEALIEAADTVTDMCCVKHALQAGRAADEGVEW